MSESPLTPAVVWVWKDLYLSKLRENERLRKEVSLYQSLCIVLILVMIIVSVIVIIAGSSLQLS